MRRAAAILLAAVLLLPLWAHADPSVGLGGTAVTTSGVSMTAVSVRESYGSWFSPGDGKVFVLVDFLVSNGTSGDLTLSTVMDFELWADGTRVDWSQAPMLETDRPLDCTVARGRQIRGEAGWEVPQGWNVLEIYYRPGGWGASLTFTLYRSDLR